ncbi:MAG: glycoside hydrolase family 2 [Verrucomicrobia bacterium]|nr:MAG: glycoside hydrolase family 2 [Verrucomicrobiota bacterium]
MIVSMKRVLHLILIFLLGNYSVSSAQDVLEQGFYQPPHETKPWCYYYWLSDHVSKEGITADMEAMAKVGIGEALIGNIFVEEIPLGPVPILSEQWWELMEHAIREGTRLGVDVGIFNSPGWSQSGGPWVSKEQSMRYLASHEIGVTGPSDFRGKIAQPHRDFQDVALIAYPAPADEAKDEETPRIILEQKEIGDLLLDGDLATKVKFPDLTTLAGKPVVIDVVYDQPKTVRSLQLRPADDPFFAACRVFAEVNGEYQLIDQFECDWRNQSLSVGFIRQAPLVISLKETTSKKFRLEFDGILYGHKNFVPAVGASLAELHFSSAARVDRYIEKQLGKMLATPDQHWDGYHWRKSAEPSSNSSVIDPKQVIHLPKITTADGSFSWRVPAGNWIVQRSGMVPTGMTNSPAVPRGRGLEIDKMNRAATAGHFAAFVGKIIERMPAAERRSLKRLVIDSYEAGAQNWTDDMALKFQKKYDYDPLPWLPVMSGHIVGSADQSDRFLWDVRRMVADLISEEYVPGLRDAGHKHGLELWMQNYGHWGYPAEFLSYGRETDRVSGEFWVTGALGNTECRAASSLANIYGKKWVSAESYTGGPSFLSTPQSLKARGDWSFTQGINHVVLHVYIQQPNSTVPGLNAPWGTEFNRHNTWFSSAREWMLYQQRVCWMLQQGQRVADVAYFIGENTPALSGPLKPELPEGHDFDWINADVLLRMADVENGDLVLPHGTRYRVLVLPDTIKMTPELLAKIETLVKKGATILGRPPIQSPSLKNFPEADAVIQSLAQTMWGSELKPLTKYGMGRIFHDVSLEHVFKVLDLEADFSSDAELRYTHRRLGEDEIYFVSNPTIDSVRSEVHFRVNGKTPELWWPHSGKIERPAEFTSSAGRVTMPLQLAAKQSVVVTFRKASKQPSIVSISSNKKHDLHAVMDEGAWRFSSTRGGSYSLTDSAGLTHQLTMPDALPPVTLDGPWDVTFSSTAHSPEKMSFNQLSDLSTHDDPDVKHFSGSIIYQKSFDVKEIRQTLLDLGKVYSLAEIKINGRSFPVVWTAPWQVDISDALVLGKNDLSITVTNAWNNRLVGDAFLENEKRSTSIALPSVTQATPLVPAGLLGPVQLVFPVEKILPFSP